MRAAPAPQPRWSIFAEVVPKRATIACRWNAVNISKTGIFVAGDPVLKTGSQIDVTLHLPGAYGPSLEVDGRVEVVWNRGPGDATQNRPSGMGCRFIALNDNNRETLDAYIDELSSHRPADSGGLALPEDESQPPPPLPVEHQLEGPLPIQGPPPPARKSRGPSDTPPAAISIQRTPTPSAPSMEAPRTPPPAPRPVMDGPRTPPPAPEVETVRTPPPPPVEVESSPTPLPAPLTHVEAFNDEPVDLDSDDSLGPYKLVRELGSGGMGDVFLAEHRLIGRRVAIKRLHRQFAQDPISVRRFFDEARLVNQISHPNIVEITDLVSDGDKMYYVMEYIEGTTLLDLLRDGIRLPLRRVLRIGLQLADALTAVHDAGIVHRDLKPDNVLLTERHGRRDFVKLLDFGIAKLRSAHETTRRQTMNGFVIGTPGYMSPEQVTNTEVDQRTDIYALGILLHEMISGKRAFAARTLGELMLKQASQLPAPPVPSMDYPLPLALERLIMGCLALEPSDRPANTREVEQVLRAVLDDAPAHVRPLRKTT